ncbi:MAG: hypothetical protein DRN07_00770 [Thermoplasmata archaeon]|nr:MAG: hypothetical protein DRN07_00770 [Thermoplasmata archaeon]
MKRYTSLDMLRGVGILGVIYLHSIVFYFGNFMNIDFDHPPLIVTVVAVMVLMGGIFGVISGAANTIMAHLRFKGLMRGKPFRHIMSAGIFLLIMHYIYNVFLGPHTHNFETGEHSYSMVALTVRNGALTFPHMDKLFEGSALTMLGWNLIFLGIILYFLFRNGGIHRTRRNKIILGVCGTLLVPLSIVRVHLFPMVESSLSHGNYALSTVLSYFVAKPYPLLPYLAFGLFGALLALTLLESREKMKRMAWFGAIWLIMGIAGIFIVPQNIKGVDMFWFVKVLLELGIFILMIVAFSMLFDTEKREKSLPWLRRFGRVSFTIYILQTPLSEIFAKGLDITIPGWNMTIPAMLVFGVCNVILWAGIIALWSRYHFRYSLEWLWVRILKPSTKMDNIP